MNNGEIKMMVQCLKKKKNECFLFKLLLHGRNKLNTQREDATPLLRTLLQYLYWHIILFFLLL